MFPNMNVPSWLGVGALAGVLMGIVTSCWAKIKAGFWKLISYAIVQIEIKDDQTSNAVLTYLIQNYQRSKVYDRTYGATYEYTRKDGKYGMVPYEFLGSKTLTFWKGWKPLLFSIGSQQASTTSNQQQQQNYWWGQQQNKENTKTLTFIRGTFDPEEIIYAACSMRNQMSWNTGKDEKQRRFFIKKIPNPKAQQQQSTNYNSAFSVGTSIAWYQEGQYRLLKHNAWDLGKSQIGGKRALDFLIFPDRIKRLIREIQIWRNNRDWYIERGLPWKRGWILYGPPGTGKCLGKDTPILMFDGTTKLVQDVQVGDLLMGPDSLPRSVLSLARGREKMYKVVPKKGDPYVVNESHILSLKMSCNAAGHKKGKVVNLSVKDYLSSSGSFRHYVKGWRTGVEFSYQEVPVDPYLLGVWLGNGHRHKCNITILQPEVVQCVSDIVSEMGIFLNFVEEAGQANTYSVGIPGTGQTMEGENPFRNFLIDYKLFKGEDKFVPQIYKSNHRDVRLEVLAGIIDTDGSLDACNCYDVVSKYEQLANDIAFLARSLGLAAYVKPCVKTCCNTGVTGNYYRVCISGNVDIIPVRVASKKAALRLQKKDVLVTGIQLELLGEDDYYGFEITGDRLFMLGDFTVTHNTALVRAFAEDEDMPLFVFSLGELTNGELQRCWEEMQAHVPCIALFEDMDNVFHGRTNVAGSNLGLGKILSVMGPPPATNGNNAAPPAEAATPKMGMLSFDCLLNCIDGVEKSDGIFTIITTNEISKIDPALGQPRKLPDGTLEFISSRPGRIDKAIELTYMEQPDKILMAKRILDEYPEGLDQMMDFLRKYPDLQETPAQFQERCSQLALSYFWMEQASKEDLVGYDVAKEIHRSVFSLNRPPKVEKFIDTEILDEPSTSRGEIPTLIDCCTAEELSVDERWHPPSEDDDVMVNYQDLRKIKIKDGDCVDLSAVPNK